MDKLPYIQIEPVNPLHRQVIAAAIKANDVLALSAVRGRLDKPIHLVFNWFHYGMVTLEDCEDEVVVIYDAMTRQDFFLANHISEYLPIADSTYQSILNSKHPT
ncbi:hypothetical protein F5984_15170 [Rudanella paleaurantiibacter]|uniref:Uncharacterized protein n=1 Tax=Rudanella paleaurantiibacter TaxID=2614655 RepID=A0A7J5TZJ7_9BACT|nr:hypothetical protein [Rudanella paleaurantiibacter]KAB7730481.1 hypothetical protein F5984_15170 [Rudanella paleaurantiibacter]